MDDWTIAAQEEFALVVDFVMTIYFCAIAESGGTTVVRYSFREIAFASTETTIETLNAMKFFVNEDRIESMVWNNAA